MAVKINNPMIHTNDAFLVFFDNIRVDQFVKDYSVTLGVNTGIGTATINMIYVPDFDKIVHYDNESQVKEVNDGSNGANVIIDDGVENMTNVRIFVKNVFNGYFVQIFGGNITSKSISMSGGERSLTFYAQDFMKWLSRTVCPIAVPFDGTLTTGDRLKWKAQGIDINKVKTVNSAKDITFKGKTLSETWKTISGQTIAANKLYSNKDTVAAWDSALDRVVVMGDIDENLRRAEVVDFLISSSLTQVDSLYVLMNDILKTLMFEFYQDRDETIRIKPPFWNQSVLKNHVIDPSLIYSYTETSDFSQMYTRVVATAGLEQYMESTNTTLNTMITPVVAVTSSGVESNSGPVVVTSQVGGSSSSSGTPSSVGGSGVQQYKLDSSGKLVPIGNGGGVANPNDTVLVGNQTIAKAIDIAVSCVGTPYVWGGSAPGGFDCSGLLYYAYNKAGYGWSRMTTYGMLAAGFQEVSSNAILPGDLIFPHDGHVFMYIGNGKVVESPRTGLNVRVRNWSAAEGVYKILRILNSDGSRTYISSPNASSTDNTTGGSGTGVTYSMPSSVGSDELLQPTYLEKKYGPLIYDCTQPLIKFSTSGATNSSSAYDALTKYARFMLNYLNSSVTVANMQCKAMPWIRPGFNIWVDPLCIDKIYYVETVSHTGNSSGNYTSLTVSLGRRRTDFTNNPKMLGSLTPGKSDDIFVNTLLYKPEDFGDVCNFKEVINKSNYFYNTTRSQAVGVDSKNSYYKYFYGVSSKKGATGSSKSSSSNTVTKGVVCNIISTYLNVRTGPGMNYSIIGKLYNGNELTVYKKSGAWYNVNYNGTSAWINENYFRITTGDSSQSSTGTYASHSEAAFLDGDLTVAQIQNLLNSKYSSANEVVKTRCRRLKSVTEVAKVYMEKMCAGREIDNPVSLNSGSR